MFDSKEVKDKKFPTIFIELTDRRGSGFILEGTRGTKHEYELDAPTARFIPNTGFRMSKDKSSFEEIRYIKNNPVISVQEQIAKGIKPNRAAIEDKIIIKGGKFSVTRDQKHAGLFDYLMDVFYNGSNPDRVDSADKIFTVIDVNKMAEQINERAILEADAIQFIGTLYEKVGDKKYRYNEEKIDALCQFFIVFADDYPGRIQGLIAHAKSNPDAFLQKATKFEQKTITEVSHALELNVIKFDGNTAMYVAKDKVVASLGAGNFGQDKKIERLADILKNVENKSTYEEFQLELEIAQENALKK